ncbi:TonB-dependent receptor [Qipengyuania sp. 6B39]|uniref:TonB-dependent receptor n=1 Tax=Qipengyuania proteolytica TaxID=2867239 RepID=UPI001C8942EF|nr:TonB-dependent receptor [Qipengyuania proteolytica]MBX7494916.1 TonB-dependent receptor [Qipengyuania proteolytica]
MLYHHRKLATLLSTAAFVGFAPAHAQDAQAQTPPAATGDEARTDDVHDRRRDPQNVIVVSAQGLRQFDLLAGTSVVEDVELQRNLDGQLGEVLEHLPGVSATGFTPGASRPVLRGFSGERVKVLVDGVGAIDVSNTSDDHAVSIDPLNAESIEVLRGPAVLLFGSQAIGGAVNVIDKRIPRRIPDEVLHIDALVRADTASDLREAGASIDVPFGQSGLVAHFGGSWRESGDLEIPGFAVAPALRAELLEEADEEEAEGELEEAEELREAANQSGFVPNTGSETWSGNVGLAFIDGDSSIGASFGVYDTSYGIPGRPGAGHHHGEEEGGEEEAEEEGAETVSIGLRQYRADLRADVALGDGFWERMKLRVGYSDYTHTEFEGDEVGTVFDVAGVEARWELIQNTQGRWRGSMGAQYYARDFDAAGAEAYVAPNRTEQYALFALQEYGDGPLQVEGSARFETTSVDSVPLGIERSFDTLSGALGLAYDGPEAFRAGVNLSRVARAPSAEELFSNGPHIATQAFEVGDPDLRTERAWGGEIYARGRIGRAEFSVAAYRSSFDNYIYLSETGEEEDELPVFEYLQQDATYTGVEAEVTYTFLDTGTWAFGTELTGEYIRAKLSDGSNIPRIPPLSLSGAIEASSEAFDLRAEVEWFDGQDKVAAFETPTEGFTFVNASVAWRPIQANPAVTLMLKADNIFDVTGRRHASFTKDFVPLAGRNFTASVRLSF